MPLIAIDAMGGDNAPHEVVEGALAARDQDIRVVLVGDEPTLTAIVGDRGEGVSIRHAGEVIGMDDDPVHAIREKKDASIVVASRMVAAREADAIVSAGSTGAAMACAAFLIGRLKGVVRPAIASLFPTGHVMMDIGANLEVKAEHLLQFAVMGTALSEVYNHTENPKVGLLNIGEEPTKGRDIEREAHKLLTSSGAINFIGNVEGRDLATKKADVIVTDGFTGNILLKTSEGAGKVIQNMIFELLAAPEYRELVPQLMPAFVKLRERLSPESVGGAHLVGTNGVVVIAHGSSSRVAVTNAIVMADEGVRSGLVEKISDGIVQATH